MPRGVGFLPSTVSVECFNILCRSRGVEDAGKGVEFII